MIKKHVRRLTQHHVSKNVLKTATEVNRRFYLEEQKQLIFLVHGGKSDSQQ
jgi:hypothetical protein